MFSSCESVLGYCFLPESAVVEAASTAECAAAAEGVEGGSMRFFNEPYVDNES
jgi:hypothetical protein